MTKLWEAAGAKFAERWAGTAGKALVFWIGGLFAWALGVGSTQASQWIEQLGTRSVLLQVTLVLAAAGLVGASAIVVERLVPPALRLLEGYWPGMLRPIRQWRVARLAMQAEREAARWQELYPRVWAAVGDERANPEERAEYVKLDARRQRRPGRAQDLMVTRVGNILRAAELRPKVKYGLDAVVTWPRLWLVMPEETRRQVGEARAALDSGVATAIWGMLFLAFAAFTPWAICVGLVVAVSAVTWWVPERAIQLSDLLEAAFDLHRFAIYDALRWPIPISPADEPQSGARLSSYLLRGSTSHEPVFRTAEQIKSRTWTPTEGERTGRTMTRLEVTAEVVATSLQWATVTLTKAPRSEHSPGSDEREAEQTPS